MLVMIKVILCVKECEKNTQIMQKVKTIFLYMERKLDETKDFQSRLKT